MREELGLFILLKVGVKAGACPVSVLREYYSREKSDIWETGAAPGAVVQQLCPVINSPPTPDFVSTLNREQG